jgi:6,7-dimethyl-8-ribityllumazine synthase
MTEPKTIEGQLQVEANSRFAIVASRFNSFIVDRLVEGAVDSLRRHGAAGGDIEIIKVPGAWEIPLVAQRIAERGQVAAVLGLGALIRGSTPHFDYIAAEVTKGLAQVSMSSRIPVTFGVLTTDTIEQAVERAGTKAGNKGAEAAMAAIELVSLMKQLG